MRGCNPGSLTVTEQHWQTIGGQYGTNDSPPVGIPGVRRRARCDAVAGHDTAAVHLLQPDRAGGQRQQLLQTCAVGRDCFRIIAHVVIVSADDDHLFAQLGICTG